MSSDGVKHRDSDSEDEGDDDEDPDEDLQAYYNQYDSNFYFST